MWGHKEKKSKKTNKHSKAHVLELRVQGVRQGVTTEEAEENSTK